MIKEKAFYLKVRKARINWGCSCCIPVGRDAKKKRTRRYVKLRVASANAREKRLFTKLISEESS